MAIYAVFDAPSGTWKFQQRLDGQLITCWPYFAQTISRFAFRGSRRNEFPSASPIFAHGTSMRI
jgi:hypothetical protein